MSERAGVLQAWLNQHGAVLQVDGRFGPVTRAALIDTFRNRNAPAVTTAEMMSLAGRLGCTLRQIRAVAAVEGGGAGWDNSGLLKCLYERHLAWRNVRTLVPFLSNPKPGGYTVDANSDQINDSWEKVADATGLFSANVAFACASWGKFQVLGMHATPLGYSSPIGMVWELSRSEAAHYECFARFIEVNGLTRALRQIDGNPENARSFASRYNGGGYRKFAYHEKIAAAWRVS